MQLLNVLCCKCFSPSCSSEKCNLIILANSDSVTSCGICVCFFFFWGGGGVGCGCHFEVSQSSKVHKFEIAECFGSFLLWVFFFPQHAVCGFL